MKAWPEDESRGILRRILDSLLYSYMNEILSNGASLHKQRLQYKDSLHGKDEEDHDESPKEMSLDDLFDVPCNMKADVLQDRFHAEYKKNLQKPNEKRSCNRKSKDDAHASRKARKRALLKTLWFVTQPTYTQAGIFQAITVIVQVLNPIVVQHFLRLFEANPNRNIFSEGIGYAIALFAISICDGLTQCRFKYLSFQSGILIKAAVSTSIYHHMLNLTSKGKQHLLTGETTNLVAIDCQKLFEVVQEGHLLWSCPLSMFVVTVLLLVTLGPSTLVGMTSMFLLVPLVKKVVGKMMVVRRMRAIYTDKRVDYTTSMLNSIKFCKLNHYEEKFLQRVNDARKEEMNWVRKELGYVGLTMAMTVMTPVIATALTYITFALSNGGNNRLSTSETFTTLVLFSVLRFPINYAGKLMGKAAQGLEACQRIADFLDREVNEDELSLPVRDDRVRLIAKNASFTVGGYDESSEDVSNSKIMSENQSLHKASFTLSGINLEILAGEVCCIVGQVGSGKSILLQGMIGDVESNNSDVSMYGSIAYASQNPFILNATLRDNILFGNDFDEVLYQKVLKACNLTIDIVQLGSDLIEIGERGVTLSGGQKARLSLARCVYSQPQVALFDDVLSALDASTGKYVFENLFDSKEHGLLSNTAVCLVTHAAHFLSRVDHILVLVKGGKVAFSGEWSSLLNARTDDDECQAVIDSICSSVQEIDDNDDTDDNKTRTTALVDQSKHDEGGDQNATLLMTKEERDFGLSDIKTWITWYRCAGGWWFLFATIISLAIDRGFYVLTEVWLAIWTSAIDKPVRRFGIEFEPQSEGVESQKKFVQIYVYIILISFCATMFRSQLIIRGGARCSEKLFYAMTERLIKAPMSYFETTPLGRILNRLTYDVEIQDISLSVSMTVLLISTGWFATGLILQVTILPWNVCALIPIIAIYWMFLLYYRKSAVDLQRLDALSRSPVQADLAEGIDGSSTIRVFGKISYFERKFKSVLDSNTSAMMNFMAAQRWLDSRFQILGSFAVLFAGIFVISYNEKLRIDVSLIAILIIWTSNFTITLGFFSQAVSESEAYLTSVERSRDMSDLSQEEGHEQSSNDLSPDWPSKGHLIFEGVCMRYRPELPLALQGLSFEAKGGERVGVVGRTGAGKSSITVALFRLAKIHSGRILLDGRDLSELSLGDVRGRKNGMVIIPQDPVLWSGTVRECLDPWGTSRDEDILEALTAVNVGDVSGRGLSALDEIVEEGGRNYSVGERQLLCLARAILSQPKVLVLDEATASVDKDTDAFIQKMIRTRFQGTTFLTIAHRLNTIMDYDKVVVLRKGRVLECGSPKDLLQNENGVFTELVDSTGKESSKILREMALGTSG